MTVEKPKQRQAEVEAPPEVVLTLALAADVGAPLPLVTPASQASVLAVSAEKSARGVDGAMATVIARHGSAPSTPGQKLYLASDRTCVGTVGGGAIEREVLQELLRMCDGKSPRKHEVREFRLGPELGMCCGGRAEVLMEPIDGLFPCLIVGAGHVATATAPLLAKVGYAVTVIDARAAWTTDGRIPGITLVDGEYDVLMNEFPTRGALLVMTHDHAEDQRAIEWGLKRGFAYVGGVGSRAKAERTRARLENKGFGEEDLKRIRMPIGAPINARLPDEIAVAIAAEMVAWKRRG